MGIILRDSGSGWDLAVVKTTGTFDEMAARATPSDLRSAMRFASVERRRGHLAAREALRELLPAADIRYDGNGAPYLADTTGLHLGFSHCRGAAVAIVADKNCAVDIEDTQRDFGRAATRYISERERQIPGSTDRLFMPAAWCAKETLYKYGRTPGTDFLRDIEILSFELHRDRITARLRSDYGLELRVRCTGGFIICHIPG